MHRFDGCAQQRRAAELGQGVKGTYTLKVAVKDSHGLAGAVATITLIVSS